MTKTSSSLGMGSNGKSTRKLPRNKRNQSQLEYFFSTEISGPEPKWSSPSIIRRRRSSYAISDSWALVRVPFCRKSRWDSRAGKKCGSFSISPEEAEIDSAAVE